MVYLPNNKPAAVDWRSGGGTLLPDGVAGNTKPWLGLLNHQQMALS
jgi:hypothetical protein